MEVRVSWPVWASTLLTPRHYILTILHVQLAVCCTHMNTGVLILLI